MAASLSPGLGVQVASGSRDSGRLALGSGTAPGESPGDRGQCSPHPGRSSWRGLDALGKADEKPLVRQTGRESNGNGE